MDDLDRRILTHLSQDARISVAVLARKLRVARSTVQARLERLESNGTIAGYTLRLGEAARAGHIRTTVLIAIEPRTLPAVLTRLRVIAQVEGIHSTSGRVDLLLQLACASTAELDDVLDRIGGIEGVRSSESLIHLSTKLDRAT
ncbi:MAG: Lrp/AsnC family transcriptional regulator [Paracoccus sp. (in: a-proteobacteria)]|uniref:Lrp/AsnC family transcriptional regulator n=1 Tax=Paracoccus sp. TaxID=267 RepID=UPI0026E06516|nr:Lrp/AsnC family transcriptional regulator [Paracoccus sp. (in: a-proteobacteria)]MDO5632180.1 Lrp/AsnC family transcriptional regulator [Paracoccus sp. (in: a-proteobacteria)]